MDNASAKVRGNDIGLSTLSEETIDSTRATGSQAPDVDLVGWHIKPSESSEMIQQRTYYCGQESQPVLYPLIAHGLSLCHRTGACLVLAAYINLIAILHQRTIHGPMKRSIARRAS